MVDAVSLKEYLDRRLDEMDKRQEQRFVAQEKAINTALTATEKRFDSVNEFRSTLADQQSTFARQDVVDEKIAGISAQVTVLSNLVTERKGRDGGLHVAGGYILGVLALIIAGAALFIN